MVVRVSFCGKREAFGTPFMIFEPLSFVGFGLFFFFLEVYWVHFFVNLSVFFCVWTWVFLFVGFLKSYMHCERSKP